MTPIGRKRATRRARPACSHVATTSSTSLYENGASSASPRSDWARTAMPAAASCWRSFRPADAAGGGVATHRATRPVARRVERTAALHSGQHMGGRAHRTGDQHRLPKRSQIGRQFRVARRQRARGALAVHAQQPGDAVDAWPGCATRRRAGESPAPHRPVGTRRSSSSINAGRPSRTSSSWRREVSIRAPQEMSKPTPPGETTPPRSTSVAATPPIGKP